MSVLDNPVQVIFANNDLNQVDGLLVLDRGDLEPGQRQLKQFKLARTNKSVLTAAEYASKPITIQIAITRSSRTELEESLDALYALLQDFEATLDIVQAGATRRYTATVDAIKVVDSNGGYAKVGITFNCSDPFGYDVESSTLLSTTTDTTGNASIQVAVGGSFEVSPVITVTITALTGGTGATVNITNSQTGIGISITRDWTAGDIIEVNGDEQVVRINGTEINPDGKIPSFLPGLRQIGYSDNLTTRSADISATYKKRYL